MNIDDYRAIKQAESTGTTASAEPVVTATPSKIQIGETEVDIEELKKGYMRQSDYTKKTQEVSTLRKTNEKAFEIYDLIKDDEEFISKIGEKAIQKGKRAPDSEEVIQLRAQLEAVQLEKEIVKLSSKYPDFNEVEVIEKSKELGVKDLEFVYKALSADKVSTNTTAVDYEALKEQIKKELLGESVGVSTIGMKGGRAPAVAQEVKVTRREAQIANAFGIDAKEYLKQKRQ